MNRPGSRHLKMYRLIGYLVTDITDDCMTKRGNIACLSGTVCEDGVNDYHCVSDESGWYYLNKSHC